MQSTTSALELGLDRLSLTSPFSNGGTGAQQGYAQQQQQPAYQHQHSHSAASSIERGQANLAAASSDHASSASALQPHQIMQPPLHQGPPPHVQLKEPQRRRGVVKFFSAFASPFSPSS